MTVRTPPTAGGAVPLLGHAWPLLRDPLRFLRGLHDHGDLVTIRLGPKRLHALCTPELVGELLIRNAPSVDVGGRLWDTLAVLLGEGLATSNGAKHQRQRRVVQPAFTPERLASYAPVIEAEVRAMVEQWQPGQVVDVDRSAFAAITRIICRTLLQVDSLVGRADELAVALQEVFEELFRRMMLPIELVHRLDIRRDRRFNRALATLRHAVEEAIDERRASGAWPDDLLTLLLRPDDGERLPYQDIRDTVIAFFVAGTGNVSGTVAHALHLLTEQPAEEARLLREIDHITAEHPVRVADLPRMPRTRNFIAETIRYRPTHWIMTRRATKAFTLDGYHIPAGADIVFSPYAMQHDPRLFSDPDSFTPDRWLPEHSHTIPRYAMAPFGVGNRKCPGEHFALTEAAVILATVAARWRLAPVATTDPTLRLGITLHPKKPLFRVEPRHPGAVPARRAPMAEVPEFEVPMDANEGENSFALFRDMRKAGSVVRIKQATGMRAWLLTRHATMMAALNDPRFSTNPANVPADYAEGMASTIARAIQAVTADSMLLKDPPEHTRLRRLVTAEFTPRRVAQLRPRVQLFVTELIDRIAPRGHAELVSTLTSPLPAMVICELLGIPQADMPRLSQWCDDIATNPVDAAARQRADDAHQNFATYLRRLVTGKRHESVGDLLATLVRGRHGDQLTDQELVGMSMHFFVAGTEPVTAALTLALIRLMQDPALAGRLRADTEMFSSAVDEFLRHDNPIWLGTPRYPTEDINVDGTVIPKGEPVFLCHASGNLDADIFPDPDRIDPTRENARNHLTFAHGIHYCLGAQLARLEIEIALAEVLRRLPDLALTIPAEELSWRPSVLRCPEVLPVTFTPTAVPLGR